MPPSKQRPLGYSPYEHLSDRPHVMVDGAARPASVLTLSHWPQSPTPLGLARDLSAEIVLAYLVLDSAEPPPARRDAEAVTNDHFDEDGLMSVWALMSPEAALDNSELVVQVAACGDFGVVGSPRAAQISFAIGALAEAEAGAAASTSERYLATLPRVEDLLNNPEKYSAHWSTEMVELEAGQSALKSGAVRIETAEALDLAVVTRLEPDVGATAARRLPGASGGLPVHAAAVHTATSASRILAFDGAYCECYFRYEGWVRTVSRKVPLRPDLAPLAAELSSLEPGGVTWEANPVGAIVGRLYPGGDGRSDLAPYVIRSAVESYLATAPPAWDPFRPKGGYIPDDERARYQRGGDGMSTGRLARSRSTRRSARARRGRRKRP